MGIFNMFKNKTTNENTANNYTAQSIDLSNDDTFEISLDLNKTKPINLEKKQFVNLNKASISLNKLRAAAGWDITNGRSYDLDLCAMLFNSNHSLLNKVYYANMQATGIFLDGDNLTGAGDGDDENIHINLSQMPQNVSIIAICVVIYEGKNRGQYFSEVNNAYVRLVDEDQKKEICRYSLTNDGGKHTAIHFADIIRSKDGWIFKAVGEYMDGSIGSISNNLF